MSRNTNLSYFWKGCRNSVPFIFVAGPFGMLFGVLGSEGGLSLTQVMTFSFTVFAGAAQFTALQLMREEAPTVIVLASALAVNLRVAMYSASLTPYLGAAPLWQRALAAYFTVDQSYALSIVQFEQGPEMTLQERVAYFFGTSALIAPLWYGMTLTGALLGSTIPDSWALDFALPLAFLAMIPRGRGAGFGHHGAAGGRHSLQPGPAGRRCRGDDGRGLDRALPRTQGGRGLTYSGTPIDTMTIWIVIIGMAVGSFVLRFVFIGFVGRRTMPEWLLRHLRYTAVAMLPALVAPLVIWPSLTVGQPDVPRLSAAAVTLAVAMISKNVVLAIFCGAATLYGLLYLLGGGV